MQLHCENSLFQPKLSLNIGGDLKRWDRALVMGVLNLTPDSFYEGGKFNDDSNILKHVEKMLNDGADIIDIGAFSSRPGAKLISEKEESKRLLPPLRRIVKAFPSALISIDTYRKNIAELALAEGANIINDISAGEFDPELIDLIADQRVPYVIMHMQGNPLNMQKAPAYKEVTTDIYRWFSKKLWKLNENGLSDVILDPGFGFGKSMEHNYRLLKELQHFKTLGCPIMVGISRKGMIHKLLNINADEALNGSTAVHVIALLNGAQILRVHDVKAAREAIRIVDFYQKQ